MKLFRTIAATAALLSASTLFIRYRRSQCSGSFGIFVSLFIAKETTKEDAKLCDLVLIEVKERDFSQNIPVSMYTKWFDYDKITNCPVVRFRQPGDFLYINESNDRKLLSDYMINEKIPGDKRDSIPLLADGNHILWVVGYRISSAVKITDKTTKIMEVKYQNEVK